LIAIDTNVLVRYIVGDDARQSALATRFIEDELTPERPGLVTTIALIELSWVLRRRYGASAQAVAGVVRALLAARQLAVENAEVVEQALALPHEDLADTLVHEFGRAAGCEKTVTFDRTFARLPGVERLGGMRPLGRASSILG